MKKAKRKYIVDVCPECKVRENDSSKKKLFKCRFCERYFCKRHLAPRLAMMRSAIEEIKDPVLRDKVYEEWRKKDGHPDWIWTEKYFEKIKVEEERKRERFWEVMERLKEAKEKEERREIHPPILYVSKEPTKNIEKVFRKFKVNLTNVLVWAIIIAIAGFFIFYYFYGSSEIRYEGTTYVGKGNEQTPLLKIKTPQEALAEKVSEFRDNAFSLEKKIHELVNKERAKYNLSSLNWDEKLAEIARYHSKDMAEKNYFDHINPLTNEDFKDRYKKFNYVCEIVVGNTIYGGAENIFLTDVYNSYSYDPNTNEIEKYNFNSLDDVATSAVEGWMNSEGHRKNILTKFFTKEGIGVYVDSDGEIFITQNFC